MDDLVDALPPVVQAFRTLQIRHFVGGSVASSFHGASRTTMDVDVVCEMTEEHIYLGRSVLREHLATTHTDARRFLWEVAIEYLRKNCSWVGEVRHEVIKRRRTRAKEYHMKFKMRHEV